MRWADTDGTVYEIIPFEKLEDGQDYRGESRCGFVGHWWECKQRFVVANYSNGWYGLEYLPYPTDPVNKGSARPQEVFRPFAKIERIDGRVDEDLLCPLCQHRRGQHGGEGCQVEGCKCVKRKERI